MILNYEDKFIGDKVSFCRYNDYFTHIGYDANGTQAASKEIKNIIKLYIYVHIGKTIPKKVILLTGTFNEKDPIIGEFESVPSYIFE